MLTSQGLTSAERVFGVLAYAKIQVTRSSSIPRSDSGDRDPSLNRDVRPGFLGHNPPRRLPE